MISKVKKTNYIDLPLSIYLNNDLKKQNVLQNQ